MAPHSILESQVLMTQLSLTEDTSPVESLTVGRIEMSCGNERALVAILEMQATTPSQGGVLLPLVDDTAGSEALIPWPPATHLLQRNNTLVLAPKMIAAQVPWTLCDH
jgi:hypothetical protein